MLLLALSSKRIKWIWGVKTDDWKVDNLFSKPDNILDLLFKNIDGHFLVLNLWICALWKREMIVDKQNQEWGLLVCSFFFNSCKDVLFYI